MNNPFDFFDEIYCINLDERTDRWNHCVEQFEILGIANRVKRFSAVKCADIVTRNKLADLHFGGYRKPNYRFPVPGAVGGSLSHREVIKLAKKQNLSNVMVFEDDFYIVNNWKENLICAINELKNFDWNIFFLGWDFEYGKKRLIRDCGECLLDHFGHSPQRGVRHAHAYAVNSNIFDYIISDMNPFHRRKFGARGFADFYYRRNAKINKYLTNPSCFQQDRQFFSDIQGTK